jgi:hypothetical protein
MYRENIKMVWLVIQVLLYWDDKGFDVFFHKYYLERTDSHNIIG